MSAITDRHWPSYWAVAQIADVAEINPGLDKSEIDDGLEVSFVPMPAVEARSGRMDVAATRRFAEVKKGYTPFREGDVLFAKITPCMENGKMAVVPALQNGHGLGSTEFHVLRPHAGVSAQYLYYFVSSEQFRRDAEHNMTGAVGQRRVPAPYLSRQEIPIPPTNEQRRIVAKIEELFSELDKGIESLTTAREQLKVYRQSVLKHAFEGKLTADWRAENLDKLERPEALVARIKRERDDRYRAALDEWRAGNGKSAKPKPLRQLSKLFVANKTNGVWPIVELGDLLSVSSGLGLTAQQMRDGPYAVYGGNGINGRHDEYFVKDPELVIGRVGAKCGVTHITLPKSWVTDNALIVTPLISSFDKQFFKWLLEIKNLNILGSSTGQPVISGSKIYPVEISFPPHAEQVKIVSILENKLEAVDVMRTELDAALTRANALRQSILKQAFAGQLVTQDPNDEPASVLLERIRAAQDEGSTKKRRSSKIDQKEAA